MTDLVNRNDLQDSLKDALSAITETVVNQLITNKETMEVVNKLYNESPSEVSDDNQQIQRQRRESQTLLIMAIRDAGEGGVMVSTLCDILGRSRSSVYKSIRALKGKVELQNGRVRIRIAKNAN